MIGVVHTYSLLERHSSFNVIRWSQYPKIKKNGCILFGHDENSMYVQCAIHRRIRMCPFIIPIILFCFFFGRKIEIIWNLFVLFPFWLCLNFFFISFLEFRFVHLVVWSVRFQIELHQCKLFHFIVDCRIFFSKQKPKQKRHKLQFEMIYIDTYTYMCVKANAKLIGKHFERVQSLAPRLICCDK